jgi:hypothetical protein
MLEIIQALSIISAIIAIGRLVYSILKYILEKKLVSLPFKGIIGNLFSKKKL